VVRIFYPYLICEKSQGLQVALADFLGRWEPLLWKRLILVLPVYLQGLLVLVVQRVVLVPLRERFLLWVSLRLLLDSGVSERADF
jgi:hypothetical protein